MVTTPPIRIRISTKAKASTPKSMAFIFGDAQGDPNGSLAWEKVISDFQAKLNLVEKSSSHSPTVAYLEFEKTFEFEGDDVKLHYDAEAGDITVMASDEKLLQLLVQKLHALGGYILQHAP